MLHGKKQTFLLYIHTLELRLLLLTLDLKSEQLLIGYKLSNKILNVFEGQKYITLMLIQFLCKRNRTEL